MRHVAITGASSGLGAALARHYAKRGCRLTLLGRNRERLEQISATCRQSSDAGVEGISCDVTNGPAMRDFLQRADDHAPVDLIIANAGRGGSDVLAPTCGESSDLARSIFEVNTMGVVHTITPLLERFVARGRGHIAIVSSLAALRGLAEAPVYSASKAAVRTYGQGLRGLLAGRGVRVTVALPGFIETPMSRSLPFRQPFVVSADRAAEAIASAIDRGAREIIFPWQFYWLAKVLAVLPEGMANHMLAASSARVRLSS